MNYTIKVLLGLFFLFLPFSTFSYANYKDSGEMSALNDGIDTNNNEYTTILTYIQNHYPKVSREDAIEIAKQIVIKSEEKNLDPKLIAALIEIESGFNKNAKSYAGAKGLGQLMAGTYRRFNIENPFSIKQNISATLDYLGILMGIWEGNPLQIKLALASYLRGEGRIKKNNGVLSATSEKYVSKVITKYNRLKDLHIELAESK